jgi:hypothetical protein
LRRKDVINGRIAWLILAFADCMPNAAAVDVIPCSALFCKRFIGYKVDAQETDMFLKR